MQGTIAPPDEDVEVRVVHTTSSLVGKKWNVVLSESSQGMEISTEDMQ